MPLAQEFIPGDQTGPHRLPVPEGRARVNSMTALRMSLRDSGEGRLLVPTNELVGYWRTVPPGRKHVYLFPKLQCTSTRFRKYVHIASSPFPLVLSVPKNRGWCVPEGLMPIAQEFIPGISRLPRRPVPEGRSRVNHCPRCDCPSGTWGRQPPRSHQ